MTAARRASSKVALEPRLLSTGSADDLARVGLHIGFRQRYSSLQDLCAIVGSDGLPISAPSLFLASRAISSRGVTGDTGRTYAECLVHWMSYLNALNLAVDKAEEHTFKSYRADLRHTKLDGVPRYSSSTMNLLITVVGQFYLWCELNGYPSSLGRYLRQHQQERSRTLAPRVIKRHPRMLSDDEIGRLLNLLGNPYRLAFRWGLVTGLRRFEVSNLLIADLPSPQQLAYFEDGLAPISLLRKGGKDLSVYAPVSLVEETNWYILAERVAPQKGCDHYVFLNRRGTQLSKASLTSKFRQCAREIGVIATLHHLRHTYAVNVLKFLERPNRNSTESRNSLKTLQVLLGHAYGVTTERYLEACEVTSSDVVEALSYLYGLGEQ